MKNLLLVYLVFIFLGTVVPLGQSGTVLINNYTLHIRWDYLIHFIIYMPLPVLLFLWLRQGRGKGIWLRTICVSVFLAASFEGLQLIIPYRRFNINDMYANAVGVLLGLVVLLIFRKRILPSKS